VLKQHPASDIRLQAAENPHFSTAVRSTSLEKGFSSAC
jgi:hypothetical protein